MSEKKERLRWSDRPPTERPTFGNLYIDCADGTLIIKDHDNDLRETVSEEWRAFRAMGAVPAAGTAEFLEHTADIDGPPLDDELVQALLTRDTAAFTAWQEKTRARIRRERLAAGKSEFGLD